MAGKQGYGWTAGDVSVQSKLGNTPLAGINVALRRQSRDVSWLRDPRSHPFCARQFRQNAAPVRSRISYKIGGGTIIPKLLSKLTMYVARHLQSLIGTIARVHIAVKRFNGDIAAIERGNARSANSDVPIGRHVYVTRFGR